MIRKSTWVVLALFAVSLIAVFLWQRSKDRAVSLATPTPGATQTNYLFEFSGNIVALRLERVGDKSVEFRRDGQNQWILAWPEGIEIDSAAAETTISQLATLPIATVLEESPGLQATGLEPPVYRLLITLDNGDQVIANVGDSTPTGSGYYVLTGERRIYIVSKYSLEPILQLVDKPPLKPTPTPGAFTETPALTESPVATVTP
jgi:hypothetical protein